MFLFLLFCTLLINYCKVVCSFQPVFIANKLSFNCTTCKPSLILLSALVYLPIWIFEFLACFPFFPKICPLANTIFGSCTLWFPISFALMGYGQYKIHITTAYIISILHKVVIPITYITANDFWFFYHIACYYRSCCLLNRTSLCDNFIRFLHIWLLDRKSVV